MIAVISQPMYFPWVGLLEQIRLADVFIHYDDVQFARGFFNRVQIKTGSGSKWLTIPLRDHHRGQLINEVLIDDRIDWRSLHRNALKQAYSKTPCYNEMLVLVDEVFTIQARTLPEITRASVQALSRYFGLTDNTQFMNSSKMGIPGKSSQRLLGLCLAVGATVYVTGHGARNYLDHELFEKSGVMVKYMDYRMSQYPQLNGEFTPYVTALDLVANCGKFGIDVICSNSVYWKDYLHD